MPSEFRHYTGREQAFIKHLLLRGYFSALIYKIVSTYDDFFYVDGFSGPWGSADEAFADTSFGIALAEMRKAKEAWRQKGRVIRMHALLVEKRGEAYRRLQTVPALFPEIDVQTLHGEFVPLVPDIIMKIPQSAFSFLFIDPKGWRIDMNAVAPLIRRQNCEIIFNFMFDFVNRAASMNEPITVMGMDELITTPEWRTKLVAAKADSNRTLAEVRKEILVEAFSDTLRSIGKYMFVAETPIFRPDKDRTLYSLVYATRKTPGLVEFRKVQIETLAQQEFVRAKMKMTKSFGSQVELFHQTEMGKSEVQTYLELERSKANSMLLTLAPATICRTTYADLWPLVMAKHAVTKSEVNAMAAVHRKEGRLVFPDWQSGKRVPSENGRLAKAS